MRDDTIDWEKTTETGVPRRWEGAKIFLHPDPGIPTWERLTAGFPREALEDINARAGFDLVPLPPEDEA